MNNLLSGSSETASVVNIINIIVPIVGGITTIVGLFISIFRVYQLYQSKKHNGYSSLFFDEPEKISSVKTLSELKTTIDGLERGSPEKEILDRHYNRLLSGNLENAAKKRYYELAKTLNPNNAPFLGYVSCFIFGVLAALFIFLIVCGYFIKKEYEAYIGLLFLLLAVVFLITILASLRVYPKKVWSKSFDKDIRDSYHYRNHYYSTILLDKSLNKSLELVIWREKQRKRWKIGLGISGFLSVLFPCLMFVFALNSSWGWSLLFFVLSFILIVLLLIVAAFSLAPTSVAPQKEALPKIETVESENEKWHEDKNKEKYFHKLIEYIARSRDHVLYIGSYAQSCSVPSHYIDLVSTSYSYMSIEELEQNHESFESLKKDFYGTIIIDSTILPDHDWVLETMSSLLKPDGELFVRIKKVKGKGAKEKLEVDKKTIEKLGDVAYFPTELELYQMFGFRKNED